MPRDEAGVGAVGAGGPQEQLQMVWPERLLGRPPVPQAPPGYVLRQYRAEDKERYLALMHGAGFNDWDETQLDRALPAILPGGFFVIEHVASGSVVATAMALHKPSPRYPAGGELAWVAGDPDHSGKGLGLAVCAAALGRLVGAGYERIYLLTDDWRLAAIKTYLKLGFEPVRSGPGMDERWGEALAKLGWRLPSG